MPIVRLFIGGWWHAGDLVSAAEQLDEALRTLGLDPVPAERLAAAHEAIADEDDARRHQIGIAACHANVQLAALGRSERVRAFGESDAGDALEAFESDEPVWAVVSAEEHAELLAKLGPPEHIERAYDEPAGDTDPLTLPAPEGPRFPRNVLDLWSFAQEQINKREYAVALQAIERILDTGYDHDDVVLIELARISTLRSLSRHEEASAAWSATAEAWLSGARRVWGSQWASLDKLHKQLKLTEGPQLLAVRERIKTAPQ